jgi:hypothetical protein
VRWEGSGAERRLDLIRLPSLIDLLPSSSSFIFFLPLLSSTLCFPDYQSLFWDIATHFQADMSRVPPLSPWSRPVDFEGHSGESSFRSAYHLTSWRLRDSHTFLGMTHPTSAPKSSLTMKKSASCCKSPAPPSSPRTTLTAKAVRLLLEHGGPVCRP